MRKYTEVVSDDSGTPREILAAAKVREIMSPDVVTVDPDEELETVADKMIEAVVHRVLVTTKEKEILGIVSSWDLVRVIRLGDRLLRWNEPIVGPESDAEAGSDYDVRATL